MVYSKGAERPHKQGNKMDIRRKTQRVADEEEPVRASGPREYILTTMGRRASEECPCPVCDYMKAIGAESEEVEGVTVHRLSEQEMMVVESLLRGDVPN